jgi:hypothetical protein
VPSSITSYSSPLSVFFAFAGSSGTKRTIFATSICQTVGAFGPSRGRTFVSPQQSVGGTSTRYVPPAFMRPSASGRNFSPVRVSRAAPTSPEIGPPSAPEEKTSFPSAVQIVQRTSTTSAAASPSPRPSSITSNFIPDSVVFCFAASAAR